MIRKIFWVLVPIFLASSLSAGDLKRIVPGGKGSFIKDYVDPGTGMAFLFIKGGCFRMGNEFEDAYVDEEPVHEVCIRDFFMGKYEVTQEQWEKVMGNNPSVFDMGGNYPVEYVSWYEVRDFIGKLNQRSGMNYRLPTEAEWEYAARSRGKKEKWAGTSREADLDDYAWVDRNSGKQSHPVGQKKPNELGLYDMSGNVWEWLADWYDQDYYKSSPRHDPQGPDRSWDHTRVIRSGSWVSMPENTRTSQRAKAIPSVRGNLGLRLVFSPP